MRTQPKTIYPMKKYFYSNGEDKEGPVTLEELKLVGIRPKTMIWYEGLDDWKEAETISELRLILELIPPPLDKSVDSSKAIKEVGENKSDGNSITKKIKIFTTPFSFNGRIRRSEYGFSVIIFISLLSVIGSLFENGNSFAALGYIPTFWFFWAQGTKRCHDIGVNGMWQIIPFYILVMIFQSGDKLMNKYGPNPKL